MYFRLCSSSLVSFFIRI